MRFGTLWIILLVSLAAAGSQAAEIPACDSENGAIALAEGFCALVVAYDLGRARHLTVNENGDICVRFQAGGNSQGGIVGLRDTNGDGRADQQEWFDDTYGTGIRWPYCYHDRFQDKKLLASEYGGDGKTVGECDQYGQPILAFPGHWASNDLIFYTGYQFPEKYKNGAFIAFHGSWNRAPLPQGGYKVLSSP